MTDYYGGYLTKITPGGNASMIEYQTGLGRASAVALDAAGNIYLVDNYQGRPNIYKSIQAEIP